MDVADEWVKTLPEWSSWELKSRVLSRDSDRSSAEPPRRLSSLTAPPLVDSLRCPRHGSTVDCTARAGFAGTSVAVLEWEVKTTLRRASELGLSSSEAGSPRICCLAPRGAGTFSISSFLLCSRMAFSNNDKSASVRYWRYLENAEISYSIPMSKLNNTKAGKQVYRVANHKSNSILHWRILRFLTFTFIIYLNNNIKLNKSCT